MVRLVPAVALCLYFSVCAPYALSQTAESAASERAEKLKERDGLWEEAQKLRGEGKLAEALTAGKKMLAIERQVLPADSEDLPVSINWLADVAEQAEDWPTAEAHRGESLAWNTQHRGAENWRTIDARLALEHVRKVKSLSNEDRTALAEAERLDQEVLGFFNEGKYPDTVERIVRICEIRKRILGVKNRHYAAGLYILGGVYQIVGELAKAEPVCIECRDVFKEVFGANHFQYALALKNLGSLYRRLEDNARAIPLYFEALAIEKATFGEKTSQLATSLNELAVLHDKIGDYGKARPLYAEALAVRKEVLGEKHPDYALSLNNLAVLLQKMGDYKQAERLYVEALDTCSAMHGKKHAEYATALNNLAGLLTAAGDYARAEPLFVEALSIRREVLGEKHPDYAASLNNLAVLYQSTGDYRRAESYFIEARAAHKAAQRDKDLNYATSGENLAALYQSMGDFARAESLYSEALAIRKEVLGEKHPVYALSLVQLGVLYHEMGDYARAEPLYLNALEIRKEVLGEKHPVYVESLSNLASLYRDMGGYARAEPLYSQALAIRKETVGEKHPEYASGLAGLASLYERMGDYTRAAPLYTQVLVIRKAALGEKHPDYASSLSDLGDFYQEIGDYARAEGFCVEALRVRKSIFGEKHFIVATSLSALAMLYSDTGDYLRAEPLLVEAVEIDKAILGEKHLTYAAHLSDLALLLWRSGDYRRAEPLSVAALTIQREVLGKKHPQYATSLNNLALIYDDMKDYARSEPLYIEALAIRKEVLGEKHPEYAVTLNNLARLYDFQGDYAKAEPLYLEALQITKATRGEKHPNYAGGLANLGRLCVESNRWTESERYVHEALRVLRTAVEETAAIQSERQQLAMGQMLRTYLNLYISLGLNSRKFTPEVFGEVLFWKGATLVRQRGMRLAADEPAVQELFSQLQRAATQLASLSRAMPAKEDEQQAWRKRLTELTQEKERLEARLSAKSAAFRDATKQVTLDQLLAALPQDAVLVDYFEFTRIIPPQKLGKPATYERQFVAFVVRHADKPEDQVTMVPLGRVAPVAAAIDRWRATFGVGDDGVAAGAELRKLVWEPVEQTLKSERRTMNEKTSDRSSFIVPTSDFPTVLVSTDGVLGRLPLAALPGKSPGTYLIEDHRLAMIPMPQLLPALTAAADRAPAHELLLVGDIDYDAAPGIAAAPVPAGTGAQLVDVRRGTGFRAQSTGNERLARLPGTKSEVEAIERLFRATKPDGHCVTLGAVDATEARFRELAPQCRMLHLATHGFFADSSFQSADSSTAAAEASRSQPTWSTAAVAAVPIAGLGAGLEIVPGGVRVTEIVPGGAAAADGRLKPEDVIQKVGQTSGELVDVNGKNLEDVVSLIRGAVGTQVRIEVLPHGASKPVVYELTRKLIPQAGAAPSTPGDSATSTHAFVVGHNPGLLSGLAFAGANRTPVADSDDGILTSQEIGVLNLSGVDTVVLSACDTGLGATSGGEGLLGLQRAFQVSGARTTIASFWKVDDQVTRALMERFYRNITSGKAGRPMAMLDALREAQLWILRNPQDVAAAIRSRGADVPEGDPGLVTSPRYWAAFTLSGDWR